MDKNSKLIPSNIIAQCDSAINSLTQNNENLLKALVSVDTFLADNDIQSDAFIAMKNQIQNFFAIINILRTANLADIDDYNALKKIVGNEELIGSELLEQLDEAMRQKAANEAYLNDCQSAANGTKNSSFLTYSTSLVKDCELLLSYDNCLIQQIQAKIDMYDEIDANSATLFQIGANLRQSAKAALEQISSSYVKGSSYISPSCNDIYQTIFNNINMNSSIYASYNSYKQDYIKNTEHDVSILSQNLRNGKLDQDSEDNKYLQRFGRIYQVLSDYDTDIKCFQECTNIWKGFLTVVLNPFQYTCVSESNSKGLSNPIYIKKDKFNVLDSGNFQISDEYVNNKGKLQETRIASWAKVKEKSTGKTLVIVNTHLPLDAQRQVDCCQQIKKFSEEQGADGYIITGDYNYSQKGNAEAYNIMSKNGSKDMATASASEGIQGDTGVTFNAYGDPDKQKRIDFFFGSDSLNSDMYTVIDDKYDGKYASDHYGILNYISFDK